MGSNELTDSFVKSKLLLEEVYGIYTKCGQKCGLCDTLIIQLHQHIKLSHASELAQKNVSTSVHGHVNHFPIIESNIRLNPTDIQSQATQHPVGTLVPDQFCKTGLNVDEALFFDSLNNTKHELYSRPHNPPMTSGVGEIPAGGKYYTTCRCCHMTFSVKLDYERHFHSNHPGEEAYKCDTCGKCFTKSQNLTRHDVRVHPGEKSFKCETCGRRFPTLINLNKHMTKSHLVEKPCKCMSCGKSFKCPSDLTRHSLVHTGERPFKCTICSMSFRQSTHLSKHLDKLHSHRGPESVHKLYKERCVCGRCGKSFGKPSSLTAHKSVCNAGERGHESSHTGEKPCECTTCGKCFTRTEYLNLHMMCHTGEKHTKCNQCNVCGMSFITPSNLNIHKLLHP